MHNFFSSLKQNTYTEIGKFPEGIERDTQFLSGGFFPGIL